MRTVKLVAFGLLSLLIVLVAVGLLLPSQAHVERQIRIQAPPAMVFQYLNDLRAFIRWSPWAKVDPETRYEFGGPEQGVGAHMRWHSEDPLVGSGSQMIIASIPDQRVAIALDFGAQGTAVAYYDLQKIDGATQVTWGFDTEFGYDLPGRYLGLLFDRWIGADYERGLADLKALVESETASMRTE